MIKTCNTCRFFRPFRPLSQLVVRDLGVEDQELVSELVKIMQDERQIQDYEAEMLVEHKNQDEKRWRTPPKMSDYCGFQEGEGVYLIHQFKNSGGDCPDHRPPEPPVHECATCRYQGDVDGYKNDMIMIERYKEIATNAAALSQGGGDQGLANYLHYVGLKKAMEAAQCYYAGKLTYRKPSYLPICEKYSTERDYIPCIVQNRHDSCPDWSQRHSGLTKKTSPSKPKSSIVNDLMAYGVISRKDK